jgi:hypothetical protein
MSRCRCTKTRTCPRCRKRASRESDPIRTLYRDHVGNARRRKKEVLWDLEEFRSWCELTGHHLLVKDGYQISRFGDVGPYCAANCLSLPGVINLRLEFGFAWMRKHLADRMQQFGALGQPFPEDPYGPSTVS